MGGWIGNKDLYPNEASVNRTDFLIGTDQSGSTKTFQLDDLQSLLDSEGYTRAQMLTLIGNSALKVNVDYKITDAGIDNEAIIIKAATANSLFVRCNNLNDINDVYSYNISTDSLTVYSPSSLGDMTKAVYDPNTVEGDVFSADNHVDGDTNKVFTATEKTKLANISGTNTGDQDLSALALKTNVLEKTNVAIFTPTTNYHPATKKYVDDNLKTTAQIEDIVGALVSDSDNLNAFYTPNTAIYFEIAGNAVTYDKVSILVKASLDKADSALQTEDIAGKQDTLVSGTNIKTINGNSVLGSGNLSIEGSGGGDALTANPLSQFAATTSAQLAGVISDETGSGALVFATSPVITTPTGIVKGDVGLGNVDNTSDVNKPVSTAQQTALNLKANLASPTFTGTVSGITKAMVGLTNVDDTSDATKNAATSTLTNKRITMRVQAVTSSATVTPSADNDDCVKITAQAAALTLANPSGTATSMQPMTIRIKDNGTARAITFGANYRAIGITLPTTTVISKTLYLGMMYNSDDTKWDVVGYALEA